MILFELFLFFVNLTYHLNNLPLKKIFLLQNNNLIRYFFIYQLKKIYF